MAAPPTWDSMELIGPAEHVPANLRRLRFKPVFRVEFLDQNAHTPESARLPERQKNHVVIHLILEDSCHVENGRRVTMKSVRLSVEEAEETPREWEKYAEKNDCCDGEQFMSAQMTISFRPYDNQSYSAFQVLSFPMESGLKLSRIIDHLKRAKMHQFSFVPFGDGWDGCRDWVLQVWWSLVRRGLVETTTRTGTNLADAITTVYFRREKPRRVPLREGIFLKFDGVLDGDPLRAYA